MAKTFGVATRLLVGQRKAFDTHCHGHSLSLAIEDLVVCFKNSSDTMSTLKEFHW